MKKLIIVALGVCILGTACSRDTNRIEENTLQQSQEQSVILQTETEEFDIPATKESSLEQEVLLALEEPSETAVYQKRSNIGKNQLKHQKKE